MDMESVYGAMGKRDAAERSGGFDREEWAARKRAEREAAFALADDTALLVNGDGAARAALARVMGRLPGHSATNALLVLAQNPDATRLGDAGYWRRAGAHIKKGERAISVIEPTKEFVRQDGTIGVLYDARKVFDVSQTTARPRLPREFAAEEVLTALVARSPAPVSPSDAPIPGGARYDPAAGEIMVERGLGAGELLLVSMERGGRVKPCDADFVKLIAPAVNVPVASACGAADCRELYGLLSCGMASSVVSSTLFRRSETSILTLKRFLSTMGLSVNGAEELLCGDAPELGLCAEA